MLILLTIVLHGVRGETLKRAATEAGARVDPEAKQRNDCPNDH